MFEEDGRREKAANWNSLIISAKKRNSTVKSSVNASAGVLKFGIHNASKIRM